MSASDEGEYGFVDRGRKFSDATREGLARLDAVKSSTSDEPPSEVLHADAFDRQCEERAARNDHDPMPTAEEIAAWDAEDLGMRGKAGGA